MQYYIFSYDENNYIIGFQVVNPEITPNYDYLGNLPDDMMDSVEFGGWYKCANGKLTLDQTRKDQIIAQREQKAAQPTWDEIIEAQVMWTALMTDTLLEEEEEEQ